MRIPVADRDLARGRVEINTRNIATRGTRTGTECDHFPVKVFACLQEIGITVDEPLGQCCRGDASVPDLLGREIFSVDIAKLGFLRIPDPDGIGAAPGVASNHRVEIVVELPPIETFVDTALLVDRSDGIAFVGNRLMHNNETGRVIRRCGHLEFAEIGSDVVVVEVVFLPPLGFLGRDFHPFWETAIPDDTKYRLA
ncbi:MAG: hypothetical protein A3D52_00275 [Candidatus Taylorbacteria bacterium RIFCSPHIGHO2_02_FULL_44_36]|uniref:Uncharacterized protein n=1 Tax=Candidatus Taylorbacteria bacterium RIFCSPLOWO2_12_FULL_44_15c TaxID=1802333 RepID=A0A1G2P6R1_9BACT|nr:MAG: hypothetical protein A3D52_00275 [Candidatus Taylorbacteria bacterium RIFCSPHIGHO2_02_FULL_44_36]OHA38332.1 MAG: hypothetical protein A3I97_02330 [Candidatus Taylorbacteria bacterium RIFCSPLOWO2_02_FULL_44_35]OHA44036.1 MAG: hypothetical protein A3G03_00565 [Candidatus Taylorbacteria bacterium RIFCSPLOWO2_12_FULL_44_15c]